ncbi:hypothetical protein [Bacillus altitudinis]|nr:hypothetical protein [Bacillus altitudinis]
MNQYRVYDKRTDETLFESKDNKTACYFFIQSNYDESDDDWEHIFIDTI